MPHQTKLKQCRCVSDKAEAVADAATDKAEAVAEKAEDLVEAVTDKLKK